MPRSVCCVPGCPVVDGVPLHCFPNPEKDAERFQKWVKTVGGAIASLDSTTIHRNQRICRLHFQKEFLYPKNRLCKLAVPSLLLPSVVVSAPNQMIPDCQPSTSKEAILLNPNVIQDSTRTVEYKLCSSGLCRCCGAMKKCRVLNVEYECLGQKEVYSDMVMDCFGLLLSHLDGSMTQRLVCATCVSRLRDALSFRRQVLQCEEAFLQCKIYDEESAPKLCVASALVTGEPQQYQVEVVKMEPEEQDEKALSDEDIGADALADGHDDEIKPDRLSDDSNSNDDLPLQRIATKRACESEKPLSIATKRTYENEKTLSIATKITCDSEKPLSIATKMKCKSEKPLSIPTTNQRWWLKQRKNEVITKLPISKVQELIREKDLTYMIDTNIISIVEYSYVCPFKCRHNNLHCYYCGQNYLDPMLLREHTLTHHPKRFKVADHKNMIKLDLTRIDCRLCNAKIDDLEEFKRHLVSVHAKKYYFESRDCVLPFRLDKDEIRCALCREPFPYFHALNKHMNEHFSNYVCETCGLGFVDRNRFLMHQARHEQGAYPCETCGKLFKAEYNRDLHIDRVHKKRGRVYCPKCDVRLMSHPQKLKHLVEVHGERPASLPCTVCDKIFETRRMLTIHWRKEHLKDYRYECQVCGQKFFTRFALNNHMPTHTGERNFKCKVCEKSYPRLKTLKEHMRIHTNDRRYRCHICGQAFIQNCSLKGHIKSQHPEYG